MTSLAPVIALADGALAVRVAPRGGALLDARFDGVPFLVPAGGPDGTLASFPLVPFGNRVEHNGFDIDGTRYRFEPNAGDPLYLHGDGWLSTWDVTHAAASTATLCLRHRPDAFSAYDYQAEQTISLDDNRLTLTLSVTNKGSAPALFGLGQHPFFTCSENTRLTASATGVWSERKGHLPDRCGPVPLDLDFSAGAPLPSGFVNNAFAGWDGKAGIEWPDLRLAADLVGSPEHDIFMLYKPAERADFFCFEPMTHLPNGHHMAAYGGLKVVRAGESISSHMTLQMRRL